MKAQCPSCKTLFNIDDAKIPDKGAHVTCSKCQTRFEVKKPVSPPAQAAQPVHNGQPAQNQKNEAKMLDMIITCPSCDHINLSMDKCTQCGYTFSAEDKAKLAIKI